jgi:hypothetical protein
MDYWCVSMLHPSRCEANKSLFAAVEVHGVLQKCFFPGFEGDFCGAVYHVYPNHW